MDITPIITGIVAAYGAILSTVTLVLTLRSKAWRIVVSSGIGGRPVDNEGWLDLLFITAANIGERPVKIEQIQVAAFHDPSLKQRLMRIVPFRRPIWFGEIGFFDETLVEKQHTPMPVMPVELLPGQSLSVTLRQIEIIRTLAKFSSIQPTRLAVVFTDAVGRSYRSRAWQIDVPAEAIGGSPLLGVGSRSRASSCGTAEQSAR